MPVKIKLDVVLFCTTPWMFAPQTTPLASLPEPEPVFVIVPVWFNAVVVKVMPFAVELSLSIIIFPDPVVPAVMVRTCVPEVLFKVVAVAFAVIAPLTVNAEVVLFWLIPVTLEPTVAVIVTVPAPEPIELMTPALFTEVVVNVTPAFSVLSLSKIKLPEPVTPPVKVKATVPVLFIKLVPPLLTVNAPLTVNAEVVLF